MNKIKFGWIAALGLASSLAFAADGDGSGTRQDRMNQAYQNYRNGQPGANTSGATKSSGFEATVRRDARKTGHFFGRQGRRAGHAVANVGRKGEHAMGMGKNKTGTAAQKP